MYLLVSEAQMRRSNNEIYRLKLSSIESNHSTYSEGYRNRGNYDFGSQGHVFKYVGDGATFEIAGCMHEPSESIQVLLMNEPEKKAFEDPSVPLKEPESKEVITVTEEKKEKEEKMSIEKVQSTAKNIITEDAKHVAWRVAAEEATSLALAPAKKLFVKFIPASFKPKVTQVLNTDVGRAVFQVALGVGVRMYKTDSHKWTRLGEEMTRAGATVLTRKVFAPILTPLAATIDGLLGFVDSE